MKMKKFLVALFALVAIFCLAACGSSEDPAKKDDPKEEAKLEEVSDADIVKITDYTSVYEKIGASVKIDQVTEENGLAYVTVEGVKYELGMDFLSMAMVYNCTPAGKFDTEEKVYNEWWRLYIQRWNYLLPEVPLYSNQYYDVYAAKIDQFVTSPYWGASQAIVGATSTDGKAIIGSSTELSGSFRSSSFGKKSPGASDQDVEQLTTGYDTVVSGIGGAYSWNSDVVKEWDKKVTEQGTLVYTIEIKTGLKDSKNQEITADYYLAATIAANTPIYGAAGGSSTGSMSIVGYKEFLAYTGPECKDETATQYFAGVKKLGDYKWSVEIAADYANYYYAITYAAFSPKDPAVYTCGSSIIVDPETKCVGMSADYYTTAKVENVDTYEKAAQLKANIANNDAQAFAFTGPYVVKSYDESTKTATLERNQYYVTEKYRRYNEDMTTDGNITTVVYVKVITATQTDQLQQGEVNILEGITGGKDTDAALALCQGGQFKYTYYDRAGYGKLAFKCDYGPTQFVEVRQAICCTINRDEFASAFTGGYGTVVDGPYYKGSEAFKANKNTLNISSYDYSLDDAKKLLVAGGWNYSLVNGKIVDYVDGTVRYKKLTGAELTEANIYYAAKDGAYKTVKFGGEYYMPLVINWFGTPADENEVTALLKTSWEKAKGPQELGFYITATEGDFTIVLYGQYYQMSEYGYTQGTRPICSCANFATRFNSAVYDFAYNWTIDQDMYMDYNCQLMDSADFYANYQAK